MSSTIDIAVNIDEAYVKYCSVMLTSLLFNNTDLDIHIHIIADKLSSEARKDLEDLVVGKFSQTVSFYSPDASALCDCSTQEGSHISVATYYRLFLGSLLPESVEKVLYLDCDLVVNASIKELWDNDITDVSVAAVEDMWSARPENYDRLKYPMADSYFNAGVILLNLKRIRLSNFEERALDCLRNVKGLTFYDQDVLNYVLHGDKLLLPFRWNVQDGFLRRNRAARMFSKSLETLDAELEHPVIIHYTGSKKPWHYKSLHPWRSCYFKYLDMTRWAGERPAMPMGYRINGLLDRLLISVGLKKAKYLDMPQQ